MNCSRFQHQAADWLDRRLSRDRSREMAAHRDECESCAQASLTEAQLRRTWHEESAAMPSVDVWPRLLTRLEAQEPNRARILQSRFFRLPQWVIGGAALVAAIGVFGFQPLREKIMLDRHSGTARVINAPPGQQEAGVPPRNALHWTDLGDVSQVDPVVNDPLGANMETVWSNIKTAGK